MPDLTYKTLPTMLCMLHMTYSAWPVIQAKCICIIRCPITCKIASRYTRDCYISRLFIQLSMSLVITCRRATAEESSRVNGALHGYQQRVLDCVLLNQGQNYIIVAPTASGKTRIPIEAAGALLRRKASAKILFLSPTVALTEQQTGQHANVLGFTLWLGESTTNPLATKYAAVQMPFLPCHALCQTSTFAAMPVQLSTVCARIFSK